MPYITESGMIDRFGEDELVQLTDREGEGDMDLTVLSVAISDAEEEVNSYIGRAYSTPLAGVTPGLIVRMTADIARYHLHDNAVTDEVLRRYQFAISFLKRVAVGTAIIPGVTPGGGSLSPNESVTVVSGKTTADRKFTMSSLDCF